MTKLKRKRRVGSLTLGFVAWGVVGVLLHVATVCLSVRVRARARAGVCVCVCVCVCACVVWGRVKAPLLLLLLLGSSRCGLV